MTYRFRTESLRIEDQDGALHLTFNQVPEPGSEGEPGQAVWHLAPGQDAVVTLVKGKITVQRGSE